MSDEVTVNRQQLLLIVIRIENALDEVKELKRQTRKKLNSFQKLRGNFF